jgi:hypothetical protein
LYETEKPFRHRRKGFSVVFLRLHPQRNASYAVHVLFERTPGEMGEESDSEGTHAFDRPQFSGVYEDVFHGKTFGSALSCRFPGRGSYARFQVDGFDRKGIGYFDV